MRTIKLLAFAALMSAVAASTASADVELSMHNGLVTIIAKDATVRQILTEWARVGQTRIVNVDRITGGPVTIELRDVTEEQALDVLLRNLSGYMAAPRATPVANGSALDPIVVMPAPAAPRQATSTPPPFVQQQPQREFVPPPVNDDDADDERPAPNVIVPPPQRGVFTPFPQPQVVNPQGAPPPGGAGFVFTPPPNPNEQPVQPTGAPGFQQPPSGPQPASPTGAQPRPGMIAPPPPQPGQPGGVPQAPPRGPNDD
jgi:hypothetical protein